MNIKEAKEQIKNAMVAYFSKDKNGDYIVPIEKQRPVFLMGPPGIGKTAIMQQIANELGVGIVSYSMTHHTRQSLLGLPMIEHKVYNNKEYAISEYTMSEIIASVYDRIEKTGQKEGILFVDEINCVSETLAPIMLQFLQYKILGKHRVPDGWIVVTAGNPPEYNNSVREFDIVTWDRLKRVDITPDFGAWKEYAYIKGVHPAVISFLNVKTDKFYSISTTVNGKEFVTARGWDDLSQMIKLYELNGIKVDENLIIQYIQSKTIARDFAIYYDLFIKYKDDYKVEKIVDGTYDDEVLDRAKNADFSEKYALIGLIVDNITAKVAKFNDDNAVLHSVMLTLKVNRTLLSNGNNCFADIIAKKNNEINIAKENSNKDNITNIKQEIAIYEDILNKIVAKSDNNMYDIAKEYFENEVKIHNKKAKEIGAQLDNIFEFARKAFSDREISIIVLEFTANTPVVTFIVKYGCPAYTKYCQSLLVNERQRDIEVELDNLNI